MRTSRTSSQPLNDKTSNKVSIASPILSKLKRRGLALNKNHINDTFPRGSVVNKTLWREREKKKGMMMMMKSFFSPFPRYSPNTWHEKTRKRFVSSRWNFHFRNEHSSHENSNAILSSRYRRIVASRQSTTKELYSVTRKDKHQNDQKNGYLKDKRLCLNIRTIFGIRFFWKF